MGEELENAASDFMAERLDPAMLATDAARLGGLLAPHFVYESHRRLSRGQPARNRAEFLSYVRQYFDFVPPATMTPPDVVAVRGERLAVVGASTFTIDGYELRALQMTRLTPDLNQLEWAGTYEPEQLNEALAELDRQHAAIIGHDQK